MTFRIAAASAALFLALVGFAALSLGNGTSSQTALAAPREKVDICHQTHSSTNPWVEISVNGNAVDKHIENHGDFLVTTAVPTGTLGPPTAPTPTAAATQAVCPPATATPPPPPPPAAPIGGG